VDEITVRPATPATWPAVEQLLGQQTGGVAGCWCMFFRLARSEFNAGEGTGNRKAFKALVDDGPPPGLVAFTGDEPAGWAAIAPRGEYSRLDRSPIAKPVDEQPVWSLVCLFVPPSHRGKGVARALVRAACEYAAEQGADVVEAYPVDDTLGKVTADEAYHGLVSLLSAEQFTEVARRLPKRPVMRRAVRG
jgi:GNAT superfamily N-acetyltransferase